MGRSCSWTTAMACPCRVPVVDPLCPRRTGSALSARPSTSPGGFSDSRVWQIAWICNECQAVNLSRWVLRLQGLADGALAALACEVHACMGSRTCICWYAVHSQLQCCLRCSAQLPSCISVSCCRRTDCFQCSTARDPSAAVVSVEPEGPSHILKASNLEPHTT